VSTATNATAAVATPSSTVPTESTGAAPAQQSSPPVTPAASTSPPFTTAAPVTTAAPIATAPVTAATTIPAAVAAASLSAAEADTLLRDHYAQVAAGDYTSSWSQLAPEFQRGKARSFEYYADFWDENDVEVGDIELVASDAREATVYVDLRWNGSNSWLTDEFTLRRDNDVWLIAGQTTIDA
jgi:hypothetical protein